MRICRLRVQNLENPLGIGTKKPTLSYQIESQTKDQRQTAYQILAASSKEKLMKGVGDIWDSGKCSGGGHHSIGYKGRNLQSEERVFWKVRVWDKDGIPSDWSETAFWEMGILRQEEWIGVWIGQGDDYSGRKSAAPVFSKSFSVDGSPLLSARLYISGLGIYEASLNGEAVADTVFDPGESDAAKSVYYVTYDVKKLLHPGKNRLTVTLGNGQYCGYRLNPVMLLENREEAPEHRYQKNDSTFIKPGINGEKKFIAQLRLKYAYEERLYVTDDSWSWKESSTVFQNWYGGEDCDLGAEGLRELPARLMQPPPGRLTAREFPPIKIAEKFPASTVKRLANGNWLFDMGRNGAGFPELHLYTTPDMKGDWVRIYPAELLREDGQGVDQQSCTQSWSERYHCKIELSYRIQGTGREIWHPRFSYQGFRYAEVSGYTGTLSTENIVFCIVRTDNEKSGEFYTSNNTINAVNTITQRSIESNMYSAFTDCPQIEKLGWIETSHLMFRSMAGAYDIAAWMRKIINDIADSQIDEDQSRLPGNESEGFMPGIVPEYYRIGKLYRDPNWGGACIFTPWEHYCYYGDISILIKMYPVMRKYAAHLLSRLKNGVLEDYAQMGEWGEIGEHTPKVLVATCSLYRQLLILAAVSGLLEKEPEQADYEQTAKRLRQSFHAHPKCYNSVTSVYGSGSQASYGCAVFSGMVPKNQKATAVEKLAEAVKLNGYHLSSGEVGLKQVFCALAESGLSDVVYKIVMNKTRPSYAAFVEAGLTTLPEYWNYDEPWHGMVRSQNHAMMGHVKEWFTCYVLGVRPLSPGFRTAVIQPYIPPDETRVKGSVCTPYGSITVDCKAANSRLLIEIRIPPGVEAVILKPYGGRGNACTSEILARHGSGTYREDLDF